MNQNANSPSETAGVTGARRARLPRLQFRLRTLFLLTLALAVLCSWMRVTISSYQRESQAFRTLQSQHGGWVYTWELPETDPLPKYAPSTIVLRLFVEERPSVLKEAELYLANPDRDLSVLSEFSHLEKLGLYGELNDENVANITAVKNLDDLCLSSSDVTDRSLEHLAQCRRLRKLRIFQTEITGSALANSPCLAKLQTLQISSEQLAEGGPTLCSRLEGAKTLCVWSRSIDDCHITAMLELPEGCIVVLVPQTDGVLSARSDSYISDMVMSRLRARRPDIELVVARSWREIGPHL